MTIQDAMHQGGCFSAVDVLSCTQGRDDAHPLYLWWLLLDARVGGFVEVVQPSCCYPFFLEALLFQRP